MTVNANGEEPPSATVADAGEIEIVPAAGGAVTVKVAEPVLVESWVEVALMVSDPEAGTVAGAVYSPELEIVPETADQVTAEL
ncbi:MAG TPA: hypothetical protein VHX63_02210 [Acidobacteriaceae bacterium]|nr:hypothetical protein [Acidobacteriaceae bacterium]